LVQGGVGEFGDGLVLWMHMNWQSEMGMLAGMVDSRLAELLPGTQELPHELVEAMRYSCLAPGKRIRPVLAIASCVACGGTKEAAIDAACAVEMVHAFSLIHDDLPAIDNDNLRRGRPTCHVAFGEAVAILAGDALFALAFEVLTEMNCTAEVRIKCVELLSKCSGIRGLVSGEAIDILSEGKPVSAPTLELIHVRKTGALIAAACEMGAVLGGGDSGAQAKLRSYGEKIGLAFQIADDVLNVEGDAEKTGKSVGSDAERGKATYVGLFGLEASKAKAKSLAQDAIGLLIDFSENQLLSELALFSVDRIV
jgi:geranylgeranyl diphosphate synthase type II